MKNGKPLIVEPTQQEWLRLGILEQSYWLLKIIDRYRDVSSLASMPRSQQDYQRETMLISAPSFDHQNSDVISAISQCTQWLLQHGLLADYPSQQNGIYKISSKGIDVIDLTRNGTELIANLISFADNLHRLQNHEFTAINLLGILVRKMEQTGRTSENTNISLSNKVAVNLSRSKNRRITLESIQSAANICKSRKYLGQKYVSSGPYDRLHLTELGLAYYDQNKSQDEIRQGEKIVIDGSLDQSPLEPNESVSPLLENNANSDELVKTNISVQSTIVYSASLLIEPLEEFRERVRSDNQISADHPEHKDELLKLLDRLLENMRFLINKIPIEVGSEYDKDISEATSWAKETYVKTLDEFEQYFSPDSVAKIVAPTTITVGLGLIGAAFGGTAGFAAGTFIGNMVTRSAKPKELSDKLNERIETPVS